MYIFPFKAYGIEPRIFIFIVFSWIAMLNYKSIRCKIPSSYINILLLPICVGIQSLISMFINGTDDYSFAIYPLQIIYLLILSYCIYYIVKHINKTISFELISKYFIGVLLLQAVIAIAMFVEPSINDYVLFDLQGMDSDGRILQSYLGMRLIGLGCFYFGGGLIYGLGLVIIMALLLKRPLYRLSQWILIGCYFIVFVIGICVARTCLVGWGISMLLLFQNIVRQKIKRSVFHTSWRFMSYMVTIVVVLVVIYNTIPVIQEKYGEIIKFGFEVFINYAERGTLETDSTNSLKTLYVWPEQMSSYLWGDGRFWGDNSEGESYYKNTDVGYIRLIYYFGIPGLLLIFAQQLVVLYELRRKEGNNVLRQMYILIFLYVLLLNLKGYIDLTPLLFIYLHECYDRKKTNSIIPRRIEPWRDRASCIVNCESPRL